MIGTVATPFCKIFKATSFKLSSGPIPERSHRNTLKIANMESLLYREINI
nr:hypothetical protein Iba_chr14aCG23090 [Ipomoea batatas]